MIRLDRNKIFSLLGLATRSRNVISGEFMTEKAIKSGEALLVIVGTDASENTRQKFANKCDFYHVPMYRFGSGEELGHAMGKEVRMTLAILDNGFANSIKNILTHLEEISEQRDGGSEHGEN
jgi:ribosomal protein L7Ae-like RNA K-turn-binding protein